MIHYKDTFGSMASRHKILCSWLDKSGSFSWVVTETCETHCSHSLQIHKQKPNGTEHSKVCILLNSISRQNYSIAVWCQMNVVGLYDSNAHSVNVYGASQPFFRKLAINCSEKGRLIALNGFILHNVITAFVVFFAEKALVYFLDSKEKNVLQPAYAWNTGQLDSWLKAVSPYVNQSRFQGVVTSDSNCLYFLYKTHIFQARLVLETDPGYSKMKNKNIFSVNRYEENKTFIDSVKHFIRPYVEHILSFKEKFHKQPWELFILPILNTSTVMRYSCDQVFSVQFFVETRLTSDITQLSETYVDILWIVVNKYTVLVTRLVINCNVPCEHLVFIYPCLLESLKVKDFNATQIVELFVTHKSDLCIIWNDLCHVCHSYRSLWFSVLPLPAVLLSPTTRVPQVQIHNIRRIPDAFMAPCCVSKNILQPPCSDDDVKDISIDASGASIATTNVACFDNANSTWCGVRYIPCSFLFYKTRPQLKSSQVGMLETQWLSTQSMDLVAYMHFPLNTTSQIHFFRHYRFISRNQLLMNEAKQGLTKTLENKETSMSAIRHFLKNTQDYESWMILSGLRLLFGQFRCSLFVAQNCSETLILWVIGVTHALLQCSYDQSDTSTSDFLYIYDFLVQNIILETNVFNLASRFRFELQQLQLCLLHGLKLKSYWGFYHDSKNSIEIDQGVKIMRRTYKLITGILHIVHLSECWSCCFSDVPWASLSVGVLQWAQQCYDKRDMYSLSPNFHNIIRHVQAEPCLFLQDVSCLGHKTTNVFSVENCFFERCTNMGDNGITKNNKNNSFSISSSQATTRCCFLCYLYNVLWLSLKTKFHVTRRLEFDQVRLLQNWNVSFAAFFGEFTFDFKSFSILQNVSHFFLYACFIGVLFSNINFNKVHKTNLINFASSLPYVRGTRNYWTQILLDTHLKVMGGKEVNALP